VLVQWVLREATVAISREHLAHYATGAVIGFVAAKFLQSCACKDHEKGQAGLGQGWEGADPWAQDFKLPAGGAQIKLPSGQVAARYADPAQLIRSAFVQGRLALPGFYSPPNLAPWGVKAPEALSLQWRQAQAAAPDWYGSEPWSYGGWASYPQEASYLFGMGR
jgi:hypothetical protein